MTSSFSQVIIISDIKVSFLNISRVMNVIGNRGGEVFSFFRKLFFIHPVTKLSLEVSDGLRFTNRYVFISRKEGT